jgi:hypothetical protein
MPAAWCERGDAASRLEEARVEQLSFISRRRAEAEGAEELARRPMPQPHVPPRLGRRGRREAVPWPAGSPPRPIAIAQLFHAGVYAEIRSEIDAQAAIVEELVRGAPGAQGRRREARIWRAADAQPEWAREVVWDCADPDNCVPMQPFASEEPPDDNINRAFFAMWGTRLQWADEDMLEQVTESGVESRSALEKATVVMGHHGGLRANIEPARASIDADTRAGWMTAARRDLWTVPSRLVPKNVAKQTKWREDEDGHLYRKIKDRVTTDDSIEPAAGGDQVDGRNGAIDRSEWGGVALPGPQTLAEALAIVKAVAADMGMRAAAAALERVALWAIDLSNAYRELAVARMEQWMQSFIWAGGVKLDLRCVFGSAHMVDFFQRVSTFVLAVARHRIDEYDRAHPYAECREAWSAWRSQHLGEAQSPAFQFIYLDDGSGFTPLAAGEPLKGAPASQHGAVRAHLAVEPASAGGSAAGGCRVRLQPFVNLSRAQVHLAIMRSTFAEAGWGIATEKVQLGLSIDLLGLGLSSEGDGCIFVPDLKRRGMRVDIEDQLAAAAAAEGVVEREPVEETVGRCSHIAQVACEGNAYLQPLYRVQNAAWVQGGVRRRPRRIRIGGDGKAQRAYREALRWWSAMLESEIAVPLAPRLHFPRLGDAGCAYFFTDAAREDGTGYGGHSTVTVGEQLYFIFREQRWRPPVLTALQHDEFSMPAGECFGAVTFADALLRVLGGVSHVVCFTDSDATAKAFTAAGSGAPQLNAMMQWLLARHPRVQLLGVHQPGIRNGAADDLSRSVEGRQRVLAAASAAGAELVELQFSPADAAAEAALLEHAMACPLRR